MVLLDYSRVEVRRRVCGVLRNFFYGRDIDNKVVIRDCGGVFVLVRLLRVVRDNEVREFVIGEWRFSIRIFYIFREEVRVRFG